MNGFASGDTFVDRTESKTRAFFLAGYVQSRLLAGLISSQGHFGCATCLRCLSPVSTPC